MSNLPRMIIVRAVWDPAAEVWVATSDDLPGLVTEADTVEALSAKLPDMVAELMEANSIVTPLPDLSIHIIAERTTRIAGVKAA